MTSRIVLAVALVATSASAAGPNGGYYQGLAILYPYGQVFCEKDSGTGSPCFSTPGSHLLLPKSAPLPPSEKYCVWADDTGYAAIGNGWVTATGEGWYQWAPRTITLYGADTKVCYLEDRGEAQNINNLKKE